MDEIGPIPSARDEIVQRIEVLQARVDGYDRDRIESATRELSRCRAVLAADEQMLNDWRAVLAVLDES